MELSVEQIAAGMRAWLDRWPFVDPSAIDWAAPLVHQHQLASPGRVVSQDPRWPAAIKSVALWDSEEIATGFTSFAILQNWQERDRNVLAEEGWKATFHRIDGVCCRASLMVPVTPLGLNDLPHYPVVGCDRPHCRCFLLAEPFAD